jgi:integrase
MSLGKPFQRAPGGPFYVRGRVRGQRVYESTGTSDPERAEAYRARRENELWDRAIHGAKAVVTFDAAVRSYLEEHPPSEKTKGYVDRLLKHFRGWKLAAIDQEALLEAYKALLGPTVKPATKLRQVLSPLRAVLEHAATLGWCPRPVFKKPVVVQTRSHFLRPEQATLLVQAAAPHLRPMLVFLLCTGCRLDEALNLKWTEVDLRGGQVIVWQKQGSAGHENAERYIDVPARALAALASLAHRDGYVFRPPKRKIKGKMALPDRYREGSDSGGHIKAAWATACRDAGLPGHWREWVPKGKTKTMRAFVPDITPHDLRHTWATWHGCVHKDMRRLMEDGCWSNYKTVTRYAKKMPDAYRDEIIAWWKGELSLTERSTA